MFLSSKGQTKDTNTNQVFNFYTLNKKKNLRKNLEKMHFLSIFKQKNVLITFQNNAIKISKVITLS
jgi:hypothetical protein